MTHPSETRPIGNGLPVPVILAVLAAGVVSAIAILGGGISTHASPKPQPEPAVAPATSLALPQGLKGHYYAAANQLGYQNWPDAPSNVVTGFVADATMVASLPEIANMTVSADRRQMSFCGWQDGGWHDLTLYQAMVEGGVSSSDTGSGILQTAVAHQVLKLGTEPAPGDVSSENTASIRVRRFESAIQARHFLVALAAMGSGGDDGFVYHANLHQGLGEVNLSKRLSESGNPGHGSFDITIHFARANVVVSVTSTNSGSTAPATTAQLAAAIDTQLAAVNLVSPSQVASARPSISVGFSKPYLMAGHSVLESDIAYLQTTNHCAIEVDVSTANSNPFSFETGYTEARIIGQPVPGGTPGLLRAAFRGGMFPVGFAALDTETMIPGVLIAWIDCYQR